ncbi:MAG: PfkB family carbohydrate kinase [Streptosporangiaceae bacterium]
MRFAVVGTYVADCFVNTGRLPAWGHEYEARSIRTTPGGKALNQAVALARLGAQVAAIGVVGDDGVGRDVLGALRRERVDVQWVDVRENVATTICLCFVSEQGDSAIMWHIDDDVAVRPETVRASAVAIERADAVLVTFEIPVPAIREAISLGRRSGARVVVAPAPPLADPAEAASLPWEVVDVLVPNENEARALLADGEDVVAEDLAGALSCELGVPTVAVTLGAAGCALHAAGESHQYPAHRVDAVDTTGAGDAFTATFAAHLVAGGSVPAAVDAAQAAAAWAVQRAGSHASMPAPASQ